MIWLRIECIEVPSIGRPDFREIGEGVRRPDDRRVTIGHAGRFLAEGNLRCRAACPRLHPANECPCRSQPGADGAFRRATTIAGLSAPDRPPADWTLPRMLFRAFSPW